MARPTALIRQVLLLQLLEDTVHKALVEAKRDLKDADVHIIQLKDTAMDYIVDYRCENFTDEAIYMKRMLEAEAKGYLRNLPSVRRHLERGNKGGKNEKNR